MERLNAASSNAGKREKGQVGLTDFSSRTRYRRVSLVYLEIVPSENTDRFLFLRGATRRAIIRSSFAGKSHREIRTRNLDTEWTDEGASIALVTDKPYVDRKNSSQV